MRHRALLFILPALTLADQPHQILYERMMDKSTLSLREQAMGGAGFATSNNAGALYTNAAQLTKMEGSEISTTLEPRYETTLRGYSSYRLGRSSSIFSPSGYRTENPGRFAFATRFGHSKSEEDMAKVVWYPSTGKLLKTGDTYSDGSLEIGFTTGYGHPLPSGGSIFSHALGGTVDLDYFYTDNFCDPISGLRQRYLLSYYGEWNLPRTGTLSLGFETGPSFDKTLDINPVYQYSSALGWQKRAIVKEEKDILTYTVETGITQNFYKEEAKIAGAANPFIGVELSLWNWLDLRTGARRIKYEDTAPKTIYANPTAAIDAEGLLIKAVKQEVTNELEYSWGVGVTPFRILSIDFALRTFLRSDKREGENQIAFATRFHW